MTFDPVKFGERLKEVRLRRGMTQEELAEKLHIGLDHMKSIERGRRSCSLDLLLLLSEELNVSSDYLLSGKGPDLSREHQRLEEIIGELNDLVKLM